MKKEKVRKYIAKHFNGLLRELRNELYLKKEGTAMQCSDVNNIDSHSHQFQVIKEEQIVNERINNTVKEKTHFQKTPISKVDKVQEGALIKVKDYYLYIGISTPIILIDSQPIIGLSTSAPIYKELGNQKVGFEFKFNGNDCLIESIE